MVRAAALIRAAHPGPSLVITAITVALTAKTDSHPRDLAICTVAVLAGQLSIGWSNDVFDSARDATAGRTDKPIVAGQISRRAIAVAAGVAVVVGITLGFRLGTVAGLAQLCIVGGGWAYNAGLKSTLASGLMYVIGFGPIPILAANVGDRHSTVDPWIVAAAALLGLGAGFVNVLPDLDADRATGVRGLPQRIAVLPHGTTAVRLIALALLVAASGMITLAPGRTHAWPAVLGFVAACVLAVVGARLSGRGPFIAALGIAVLDVVAFVTLG